MLRSLCSSRGVLPYKVRDKSGRKPSTEVRNIEFISKQPSKFFVFTFLSLQFKFSVNSCILCCLIAFPPHPFAYFLTSGFFSGKLPITRTISISLKGSSYRESTVKITFEHYLLKDYLRELS